MDLSIKCIINNQIHAYTVLIYHESQSDIIHNGRKVMTVTTLRVIIADVIVNIALSVHSTTHQHSDSGSWGINIPWNIKEHYIFELPLNTVIMLFSVVERRYKNRSQVARMRFMTCIKLMKGKALRKHSLHVKIAASVLLKLFISSNE